MHLAHFTSAHCMRCGCALRAASAHTTWVQTACCVGARLLLLHASSTTLLSPCTGFSAARVPQDLDAVVIGSGIGGLAAACILAKVGKRVLVLEQHDQAGGCCHTFQERGNEFDVGKEQRALVMLAACDRASNLQRNGCAKRACSTCDVGMGRVCVVHALFACGVNGRRACVQRARMCDVCSMHSICLQCVCVHAVCVHRACVHAVCRPRVCAHAPCIPYACRMRAHTACLPSWRLQASTTWGRCTRAACCACCWTS